MTCIVAVRQDNTTFMAGDRAASDEDTILPIATPKIWNVGPYLIGYAGTMEGERMRQNFVPPTPDGKSLDRFMHTKFIQSLKEFYNEWWVDTGKDSDFGLIIAIKDRIYEHNSVDMSLTLYQHNYLSIGSGSAYAYGYLDATERHKDGRKRAINAVNTAIKFSPTCMGPVDILSI